MKDKKKKGIKSTIAIGIFAIIVMIWPIDFCYVIYGSGIKEASEFINIKGADKKSNFYEPYIVTSNGRTRVIHLLVGFLTGADFKDSYYFGLEYNSEISEGIEVKEIIYPYFKENKNDIPELMDILKRKEKEQIDYTVPIYVALKDDKKYVNFEYFKYNSNHSNMWEGNNINISKFYMVNGKNIISSNDHLEAIKNHKQEDALILKTLNNEDKKVTVKKELTDIGLEDIFLPFMAFSIDKSKFVLEKENSNMWKGSSGYLSYALHLYNQNFSLDLTKGNKIVVTGTLNSNGQVEAITEISHKIDAAVKSESRYFMLPEVNYMYAKDYIEKENIDIVLIPVRTFDDAIETIKFLFE